ncbi:sulfite exporter TauE/SafE family protein [Neobacillus ginsengisoli]|uniref:Probable membrane transporter protein n=2 Tax=Neobacillus TaxID=2675232 RepID=A0ABT9XQX4_9BACI|nr:sulfite exporter TauE/SafE family protein [Neobacillus ginsengisoli]MCM2534725.1 sulfite exporter TauE/SafE family protein [Neobacillus pocheonensis]MDQ0197959.1 putative membrane protein YfcA [Neobacillus ginsengisoli]
MTTFQVLLSIVSGTIVGFVLGLLGGGGSILAVPLLLYVVGMKDPHVVIGTTASAVAINAYANLIPHARAGHVQWKAAIVFAVPGALSAYTGSIIGKLVPGKQLLFLFAILMIVMGVKMAMPKKKKSQSEDLKNQVKLPQLIIMAILVGLLSGFFGIGGGFLIVPGLIFAARMPMIAAIGSSLVSVGTFGLTTAVSYSISGLVNWWVMLAFVGGGVGGGMVGAWLAARLSKQQRTLHYIFSGVVMLVAIYMLIINAEALDL